jgi:hypothetical protein
VEPCQKHLRVDDKPAEGGVWLRRRRPTATGAKAG